MHFSYRTLRGSTLALGLCTLAACNGGGSSGGGQTPGGAVPQTQGYNATVLVSNPQSIIDAGMDNTGVTDGNLSKPWDLAAGDGPVWVADAHTSVATVYNANGVTQHGAISIPGSRGGSHVTGVAANTGAPAFQVSANGVAGPAAYLFSTSTGTLAAWSAGSGFGNQAVTVYSDPAGSAEYTGLALLASGGSQFLYAADFKNGRIDTFDSGFNKISTRGDFRDPNLPAGFKPFNIQPIGNRLAVVYAKPRQVNGVPAVVTGAGTGVVNLFDTSGNLTQRLVTGGVLNAPRGIALAPDNFGELSGKVLVASSGDGRINAFDRNTGEFAGTMKNAGGNDITIPGISALAFRNGDRIGAGLGSIGDNTLFFAAGLANSVNSAFGRLQPAPLQ